MLQKWDSRLLGTRIVEVEWTLTQQLWHLVLHTMHTLTMRCVVLWHIYAYYRCNFECVVNNTMHTLTTR